MKLTVFLLLTTCMMACARTGAQTVSIDAKNVSLDKIFSEIRKQTGYEFIASMQLIKSAPKVTMKIKNATVTQVLDACFKNLPLTYEIDGKTIIITSKSSAVDLQSAESPTINNEPPSPPTDIHGRLIDEDGEPVAGASVRVKGTGKGTTTNNNGEFSMQGISEDAVLVFSGVNIETTETKVGGKTNLSVSVKNKVTNLGEVIINKGYYTEKQKLSTGDVSVVTGKDIEKQPVANPLAALEGRVPGLSIAQTSGIPGGAFTVQIRGQNSLLNGNDPFYVIDGVPYSSQTVNIISSSLAGNSQLYGYNSSGGNPLNYINPADIESISILKDADATSIYGSRAANGAILITTKKGKAGDTRVDINAYSGVGQVTKFMHLMNTQQYLTMRHEAFANDQASPGPAAYEVNFWDTTRYTNWQKVLYGNKSHYNDAQVSISGGSENIQYLIGGGYHRETTVFQGTFADKKGSAHFNLNSSSLNRKFKISLTANYTADISNVPSADLTPQASFLPPDAPPLYNPDGTLNWAPKVPGRSGTWTNPLNVLFASYKGRTNNLVSNTMVTYNLLSGLNFSTSLGYTHTETNEIITFPTSYYDPGRHITSGNARFSNTNTSVWIIEPQVTYSLKLANGILKALVGTTFEENTTNGQGFSASGFSNDAFLQDIQAASSVTVQSAINTVYKYNAVFGRLNYNWQDKYILNATARRDGSSRFGPASQFANFASVGGAWIFSQEHFIKHSLPFISFGKLRVSYGTSGNDQIGDYRFLDLYTLSQYSYQNSQGLYPGNLFNPYLAWEVNRKMEGGIMLGVLKDRITVEGSYYINRSANQLVTEPLSTVTGFNSIAANLNAVVQNSGLEFVLNTTNIKTRNFTWTSSLNFSEPRNKLISFPNLSSSSYANKLVVGQPISIKKVLKYAGVNDSAGIYQFITNKGAITFAPSYSDDITGIVNLAPTLYGGFENSFVFKGFQLDILFQFVKQTAPDFNYFIGLTPGFRYNQQVDALNRWKKPGDQEAYEQYTQNFSSNAYTAFSYYTLSNAVYTDASFIRLKNLAISYNLPESALHKMHIRNLRIYANGQNLLTITKYLGTDPETQGLKLPPLKVLVAGIQVGL